MTCRHLKEIENVLKDMIAPVDEPNPQLKIQFWLRCGICDGCEFMIRPLPETLGKRDAYDRHEMICSQCGRMYLL